MLIGVISDTHGLLRAEAASGLAGVDHIFHAGDVGDWAIVEALRKIAPLTVIRGNTDRAGRCASLPGTEFIELGGLAFYMLHDLKELDLDPAAAEISVVISGHSHQAAIEDRRSVLYLNPGSAGPRRFSLPVSLGLVRLSGDGPHAEIVRLLSINMP